MSLRPRVVAAADDKLPNRLSSVLQVGTRFANSTRRVQLDFLSTGVKNKRSESDEEIMYVLGKRTVKSMPMFLDVLSSLLYRAMNGEDPDDDSSTHEVYLLDELRVNGTLNTDKIIKLLEDERNHLKVMAALAHMMNYDNDLGEATMDLEDADRAEFERIWALLPRWALAAAEPAAKRAA